MYIEKIQLSKTELNEPVSVTFQKGVFCLETDALNGIDVAKILSFFFYGTKVHDDLSGTLHFCENSVHYRINASSTDSALYKITTLAEEKIELEDGMTFGEALFGVPCEVFEPTLSLKIYENPKIAKEFSELLHQDGGLVGIYDLMNRIRDAANSESNDALTEDGDVLTNIKAISLDESAQDSTVEPEKTSLEDTLVVPCVSNGQAAPLEATRVLDSDQREGVFEHDILDETIKIAPAPDLEIEAMEVAIRRARRDIDRVTTELEEISKKVEIGKMSDLAEKNSRL